MLISNKLRSYIKDYFQDEAQELIFYQSMLHYEKLSLKKDDNIIRELNKIVDEFKEPQTGFSIFSTPS